METDAKGVHGWLKLPRSRRVVVVIDVVESVRLMELDEENFIGHWRQLVSDIRQFDLPPCGGRVVKSLGDGLLLEFESVHAAVNASLAIQRRAADLNRALPPDRAVHLRAGMHVAEVVSDELDIYGVGVNLCARLATLAAPGEIIVSPQVRADLVDDMDAQIEDLGECWLKNLGDPVRAFRVGPAGQSSRAFPAVATRAARETVGIAVIPFEARGAVDGRAFPMGQLLADDVIAQLSRVPALRVISRLSTAAFQLRPAQVDEAARAFDVDYVLHGSCVSVGGRTRVQAMLVDASGQEVVWSGQRSGSDEALMMGEHPLVDELVESVCAALIGHEVRRACQLALPTLSSYTILLGAIAMLHSLSLGDFRRAHEMLGYLIERHPKSAAPRAWLGLWHVMKVGQGWSHEPMADAALARSLVEQALALEPAHSLSLAVDGLVCAYVHKDIDLAMQRYDAALQANPSESLAWLYRSACFAYREQGDEAVVQALHARSLSPLDPLKYYYENFVSTAMLAAGDVAGAIEHGQRSLRANCMHGPTLRILAIAYALAGDMESSRKSVASVLALEPGFTVSTFRKRYPGQGTAQVERYARALLEAGLPP